ncbi:MAG: FecR domain-containing protein [Rhodospirillales bacterium]|nr:FecR domain-containing protein [Rhodospirillales bacterium]
MGLAIALRSICLLIVLFAPFAPARAAEVAGAVARLQGTATAELAGASRDLAEGAALRPGDRIQTGAASRLEMRMRDGAVITLGENANFTIGAFEADERGGVFGLLRGAFLAISGKIDDTTSSPMTVITPIATAGIRGTTVWGEQSTDTLEMALFEGNRVFVEAQGRRVELTEPLFGTTVVAGQAPTPPKRWGDPKIAKAQSSVAFQ